MELNEWNMRWTRRSNAGVCRLLMTEWDPIGVRDVPEAVGEYDSYALPIARMLREGRAASDIAGYLTEMSIEWIGLGDTTLARANDLAVAEQLARWYADEMARVD